MSSNPMTQSMGTKPKDLAPGAPADAAQEESVAVNEQLAREVLGDFYQGPEAMQAAPEPPAEVVSGSPGTQELSREILGTELPTDGLSPDEAQALEQPPVDEFSVQEDIKAFFDQPLRPLSESFQEFANLIKHGKESDEYVRLISGFAGNDTETFGKLTELFGKGNVRLNQAAGEIQFRRSPGEDFRYVRDLDKPGLSFGDVLGSGRFITDVGVEMGTEAVGFGLGGAGAGATSGGMLAPLGAVQGRAIGGAIGASAAVAAGDFIAETLLDIERDPERSKVKEQILAGSLGAAIPAFGAVLARRAVRKRAEVAAKKALGDRTIAAGEELEKLTGELRASPFRFDPDGKFEIDPFFLREVTGDVGISPALEVAEKKLRRSTAFMEVQRTQEELSDQLLSGVRTMLTSGAESGDGALFQRFKKAVKSEDQLWGESIGSFRNMARLESGAKPVTPQNFLSYVSGEAGEGGGRALGLASDPKLSGPGKLRFSADSIDESVGAVMKPAEKKDLAKLLNSFSERFDKAGAEAGPGQVRFEDLNKTYGELQSRLKGFSARSFSDPTPYQKKLMEMRDVVRDDLTEGIGTLLGPGAQDAYQASLARFSQIKTVSKQVSGLLRGSDMARESFAKKVFDSSLTGKQNVAVFKELLKNDPGLWKDLKQQRIGQLVKAGSQVDPTGNVLFNPKAVRKELSGLDAKEISQELFEGADISRKEFDNVMTLAGIVQGRKKITPEMELSLEKVAQQGIVAMATRFASSVTDFAKTVFDTVFGGAPAFQEWLGQGGVERIAKRVDPSKRDGFIIGMQKLLLPAPGLITKSALDVTGNTADGLAPAAARGATQSAARQGFRDSSGDLRTKEEEARRQRGGR